MPKMHPVHYQTHPLAAYCGASTLDPGVSLLLGTSDPAGVTCAKCIMVLPSAADFTPITETEHAELVRSARGKIREAIGSLAEWLEQAAVEDARRQGRIRALTELLDETPRWALGTRRAIRKALVQA